MKVWREVLTKNFILMIIAMIICGTAQMAVNTNSAAYAVGVLGLEQARFGTVVAIAGMVVVVLYPLLGILCDKMRHGLCGAIGGILLAAGFILYMQLSLIHISCPLSPKVPSEIQQCSAHSVKG